MRMLLAQGHKASGETGPTSLRKKMAELQTWGKRREEPLSVVGQKNSGVLVSRKEAGS